VSGIGEGRNTRTVSVEALEDEAASWLLKRHFFNWTPDDQTNLDAWLETPSNRVVYWRLNAALARTERLAALRLSKRESSERTGRARRILLRVVAAVAVIGVLSAAVLLRFQGLREQTFATAVGGHRVVALADGSSVELNTNTVIRVRSFLGRRTVTLLNGEAFFQIRHDAAHPFAVEAAGHRVTDLGTKFLVKKDEDRLEVSLVEGRARFESVDASIQARSALLVPGDVVIATATSMSLVKQAPEQSSSELGWRRGVLIFHHTTLADVAAEFNRYNQRKLIMGDSAAARLQIDGTFPTNDLEAFTDIAGDIMHLRVEKRKDEIVISR
jgi:transmembrane sensor